MNELEAKKPIGSVFGELSFQKASLGVKLNEYAGQFVIVEDLRLFLAPLVAEIIEQMVLEYAASIKTYGKKGDALRDEVRSFVGKLFTNPVHKKLSLLGIAHCFEMMTTLTKPFDKPADGFTMQHLFSALNTYVGLLPTNPSKPSMPTAQPPKVAEKPKEQPKEPVQDRKLVARPDASRGSTSRIGDVLPGVAKKKEPSVKPFANLEEFCASIGSTSVWFLEEREPVWRDQWEAKWKDYGLTFEKYKEQQIHRLLNHRPEHE